jgi:hypothetical protein
MKFDQNSYFPMYGSHNAPQFFARSLVQVLLLKLLSVSKCVFASKLFWMPKSSFVIWLIFVSAFCLVGCLTDNLFANAEIDLDLKFLHSEVTDPISTVKGLVKRLIGSRFENSFQFELIALPP